MPSRTVTCGPLAPAPPPLKPNACCMQLYSGVTTVDVVMLGLALSAAVSRKPVIAVASGSRAVLHPPPSSGVASLLQRCRKTMCRRGGLFLSYRVSNGTNDPSFSTAVYIAPKLSPGHALVL